MGGKLLLPWLLGSLGKLRRCRLWRLLGTGALLQLLRQIGQLVLLRGLLLAGGFIFPDQEALKLTALPPRLGQIILLAFRIVRRRDSRILLRLGRRLTCRLTGRGLSAGGWSLGTGRGGLGLGWFWLHAWRENPAIRGHRGPTRKGHWHRTTLLRILHVAVWPATNGLAGLSPTSGHKKSAHPRLSLRMGASAARSPYGSSQSRFMPRCL